MEHGSNLSTTPIAVMGCRQFLPLSVVQLKGKHCRKSHCRNGVVDGFEHGFTAQVCNDWLSDNFENCTSEICTSGDRTSGEPPVIFYKQSYLKFGTSILTPKIAAKSNSRRAFGKRKKVLRDMKKKSVVSRRIYDQESSRWKTTFTRS